jgi:uncharacterized membrane protein YhdT
MLRVCVCLLGIMLPSEGTFGLSSWRRFPKYNHIANIYDKIMHIYIILMIIRLLLFDAQLAVGE